MSSDSPAAFFAQPSNPLQRRYELLRAFFLEGLTAEAVARRFGYAVGSVYAITRDFRRLDDPAAFFFRPADPPASRPPTCASASSSCARPTSRCPISRPASTPKPTMWPASD